MAVNKHQPLARILEDTSIQRSYSIWLWHQLTILHDYRSWLGELNDPGMKLKMEKLLAKPDNSLLSETIEKKRNQQLLSPNQFEWLNEGKRQAEWLNCRIATHLDFNQFMQPIKVEATGIDLLYATIDLWDTDIIEKANLIYKLRQDWTLHIRNDKQFHWFRDDEQKCSLAGKWLNSRHGFSILELPTTVDGSLDNYEDLIIFFDNCTKDQKNFYIGEIKKSWSRQKHRSRQSLIGKKQYNFVLSEKAISRLDQLSDTYELSRAKILDILLKMESEQNRYLPERIRLLKDES